MEDLVEVVQDLEDKNESQWLQDKPDVVRSMLKVTASKLLLKHLSSIFVWTWDIWIEFCFVKWFWIRMLSVCLNMMIVLSFLRLKIRGKFCYKLAEENMLQNWEKNPPKN